MYAPNNYCINDGIFNVAIYLRLSCDDEIAGQSESIGNQRDFVTRHVLEQGWNIADVYIDDGFTGLNFNRPDFKRMITDVERKKVNLVITKDLSRLGRDYIDTGYYLERYFPSMNVRYIALNDGIDTFALNNSNNDMTPFKAVMNDMYAKDVSKKVRATMDTKRINGQFIGAYAPYGYKKDPQDKNKFVIDDEVAHIVKRIFSLYLNGESMCGIVKILNNEGIPSPTKYKSTNSTYKNAMIKHYIWTQETIKRMLTNPTYVGSMTQHRQEKINYKLDKFRKIPPKDWIVVENTHQPIVDKEYFELIQEMIKRKIIHYEPKETMSHLLNGLVFCKDCGQKMTYRRGSTKKMTMLCMSYSKYGADVCSSHRILESVVDNYVIDDLKKISEYVLSENFYKQFESIRPEQENFTTEIERINKRLAEINNIIKNLYLDKVKGIIDDDMFLSLAGEFKDEKEILLKKCEQLHQKELDQKLNNDLDYLNVIKNIANFDELDKTILMKLIQKIEITGDRNIEINYAFKNPYK